MRLRELNRLLPPEPPFPPAVAAEFRRAMTKMLLERGHVRLPEGELIAFRRMNDPYSRGSPQHRRAHAAGDQRGDPGA